MLSYGYTVLAGTQACSGASEGPAVRPDRTDAAADGVLRRGRRRPARRHRPSDGVVAGRAFAVGQTVGLVPRTRSRGLLCRERGDRRGGGSDRATADPDQHGWSGDDAGGGLGDVHPDEVGPISAGTQRGGEYRGADETEAVAAARRLLGYFRAAPRPGGGGPDGAAHHGSRAGAAGLRRHPGHRTCRRHSVTVAAQFAREMVTALARIDGRPVGCWPTTPVTWPAPSPPRLGQSRLVPATVRCVGLPVISLITVRAWSAPPGQALCGGSRLRRRGRAGAADRGGAAPRLRAGRRRWPAAVLNRCSPCVAAHLARWAGEPSGWMRKKLEAIADEASASRCARPQRPSDAAALNAAIR